MIMEDNEQLLWGDYEDNEQLLWGSTSTARVAFHLSLYIYMCVSVCVISECLMSLMYDLLTTNMTQ